MNSHTGRYPVSFMPIARVGVDVTTRAQTPDHRAIKKDDFSPSNGFSLPATFSSGVATGAEVAILESIVMLPVST